MNVLFLNPPFLGRFSRTSRSPAVTKGGTIYYPFWLAYAAGVTEREGFEVRLVDAPADGLSMDDIAGKLRSFRPDLAVIDTSTPSIFSDARSAEFIKSLAPDCFVVLVGTHPSAMPEWTIKLSNGIDAVARGEYDYIIRDLAFALGEGRHLSTVPGLSFRKDGDVHHNRKGPLITDLDSLPFVTSVYKKHLSIRNYYFAAANYPMVMIITGRGCPHRCFFCVYPQTFHSRKYRPRSAENIVEEFRYIKKNLPEVKEVGIEDDTFTVDKKRVESVCDMLIAGGIRMKWYCNCRADIDYDLLIKMRKSGCRLITVGFETGEEEILRSIHKGLTRERMLRFARDARRAEIMIHGCLMAGNPGETEDTMWKNFSFAVELNCDSMQFYPLFVYPGTEAYEWAKNSGFLRTENYREWLDENGDYNCVIDLPGLPAEKIVSLCKLFFVKYHFRLRYILMKLRQALTRPPEGLRTAKSASKFVHFLVKDRMTGARRGKGAG